MQANRLPYINPRWPLLIGLALAAIAAWLIARDHGLFPFVFADEMLYSAFARRTPLPEAAIPSYLYFAVYGSTNACGADFLSCTRILNVLFLVGAGPFIYLMARTVAGRGPALAVMLLALMAPLNAFSAYFMPETMYFFGFHVLAWLMLTRVRWQPAARSLAAGVLLGLLMMVKIHALFLLPALALFAASQACGPNRLRAAASAALLLVASALLMRFGIGYLVAGARGLSLFGSLYGEVATLGAAQPQTKLLVPAWLGLRGHVMTLALLFGVPMALLVQFLFSRKARSAAGTEAASVQLFAVLVLGAALAMTVAFTASIAGFGPNEALRLHLRYYNFSFPLLLAVAAGALGKEQAPAGKVPSWPIAAAVAALCVAGVLLLPGYVPIMTDGPEIASLRLAQPAGRVLAALAAITVLVWAVRQRAAAMLFLFVLAPALTLNAMAELAAFRRATQHATIGDRTGIAVRDLIPRAERKHITVAGVAGPELMRAKFFIDDPDVTMLDLPPGAPFDIDLLPVRDKWLVVIGPHALPKELAPVRATADFALIKVDMPHRTLGAADIGAAPGKGLLAGFEGLSKGEGWGRWSDAREVVLRFNAPLPRKLHVILEANAFGPNVGKQFIARVGAAEKRFKVPALPSAIFLPFDTDGKQDTLRIEVPEPTAPSSLSNSVDHRTLGIGLVRIEIGTAPEGDTP
jgi:hypothetical protein